MDDVIWTARLELRPVTAAVVLADMAGPAALGDALGAAVPDGWPPPLVSDALPNMANFLERHPDLAAWSARYWVREETGHPVLVGLGGFKGAPAGGDAELGYSVVEAYQRQGYATEAVAGMVAWAFERDLSRVVAHTLPGLHASIKVLERNGFELVGEGEEPGTVRFERRR